MSFADDEEFEAFIWRDDWLPMITAEAVGDSLLEMKVYPSQSVTLGWLAMAVRRALAASMKNVSDGPERMSNRDIRRELHRLADVSEKAWASIFDRKGEVDSRLWDHALNHWTGNSNALGASGDPRFGYNRFQDALEKLNWLAGFLRAAAKQTEPQSPHWRQSEQRNERISRAYCLAPIFERAFGQEATANNYSGSKWSGDALASDKTLFMDFYQRMVDLAFGEKATPDLSGVTKEACRLHRNDPVTYDGIIPGF